MIFVLVIGYSQDVKYTTFYDTVGRYILLYRVDRGSYFMAYVCDGKLDTVFRSDLSIYKSFKSGSGYIWRRIGFVAQAAYVKGNKCFGSRLKELN